MLEQAIADLTTQVTELNRLMAQLVASTADTVQAAPKRTRKAKPEPAAENHTPATPSAPAAEAPATAQATEPPPATPSEAIAGNPAIEPAPDPTPASSGATNDSAPSGAQSASGASTGAADPLDMHLKIKATAMRLAAVTSKERVMAFIKDKFHVPSLAAIPDDAQQDALTALENELTKAQQGLKEAA